MANGVTLGDEIFETYSDRIEVTSRSRPDTSWRYVDRAGHEHRYYYKGEPAKDYDPSHAYDLPTLEVVQDEPYWCSDCHDEHQFSHYECRICREHISPGRKADDEYRQYVRGLTYYRINGEGVTEAEFKARAEAAIKRAGIS